MITVEHEFIGNSHKLRLVLPEEQFEADGLVLFEEGFIMAEYFIGKDCFEKSTPELFYQSGIFRHVFPDACFKP